MNKNERCHWSHGISKQYCDYHDKEWGVPVYDDRTLFEFLILEGAQAGLSWATILSKRSGYQKNFAGFDPAKVAKFTDKKIEKILLDPSIVRNKLKVSGARKNAIAFLAIQKEYGSFAKYLWHYVGNKQIKNSWQTAGEVPTTSLVSDKLSKDLKKRGFTFVGSTILYAYMQAVGLVNDHTVTCYRYKVLNNTPEKINQKRWKKNTDML